MTNHTPDSKKVKVEMEQATMPESQSTNTPLSPRAAAAIAPVSAPPLMRHKSKEQLNTQEQLHSGDDAIKRSQATTEPAKAGAKQATASAVSTHRGIASASLKQESAQATKAKLEDKKNAKLDPVAALRKAAHKFVCAAVAACMTLTLTPAAAFASDADPEDNPVVENDVPLVDFVDGSASSTVYYEATDTSLIFSEITESQSFASKEDFEKTLLTDPLQAILTTPEGVEASLPTEGYVTWTYQGVKIDDVAKAQAEGYEPDDKAPVTQLTRAEYGSIDIAKRMYGPKSIKFEGPESTSDSSEDPNVNAVSLDTSNIKLEDYLVYQITATFQETSDGNPTQRKATATTYVGFARQYGNDPNGVDDPEKGAFTIWHERTGYGATAKFYTDPWAFSFPILDIDKAEKSADPYRALVEQANKDGKRLLSADQVSLTNTNGPAVYQGDKDNGISGSSMTLHIPIDAAVAAERGFLTEDGKLISGKELYIYYYSINDRGIVNQENAAYYTATLKTVEDLSATSEPTNKDVSLYVEFTVPPTVYNKAGVFGVADNVNKALGKYAIKSQSSGGGYIYPYYKGPQNNEISADPENLADSEFWVDGSAPTFTGYGVTTGYILSSFGVRNEFGNRYADSNGANFIDLEDMPKVKDAKYIVEANFSNEDALKMDDELEYNVKLTLQDDGTGAAGSVTMMSANMMTDNVTTTATMGNSATGVLAANKGVYLTFNAETGSKLKRLEINGSEYKVNGSSFALGCLTLKEGVDYTDIVVTYTIGQSDNSLGDNPTIEALVADYWKNPKNSHANIVYGKKSSPNLAITDISFGDSFLLNSKARTKNSAINQVLIQAAGMPLIDISNANMKSSDEVNYYLPLTNVASKNVRVTYIFTINGKQTDYTAELEELSAYSVSDDELVYGLAGAEVLTLSQNNVSNINNQAYIINESSADWVPIAESDLGLVVNDLSVSNNTQTNDIRSHEIRNASSTISKANADTPTWDGYTYPLQAIPDDTTRPTWIGSENDETPRILRFYCDSPFNDCDCQIWFNGHNITSLTAKRDLSEVDGSNAHVHYFKFRYTARGPQQLLPDLEEYSCVNFNDGYYSVSGSPTASWSLNTNSVSIDFDWDGTVQLQSYDLSFTRLETSLGLSYTNGAKKRITTMATPLQDYTSSWTKNIAVNGVADTSPNTAGIPHKLTSESVDSSGNYSTADGYTYVRVQDRMLSGVLSDNPIYWESFATRALIDEGALTYGKSTRYNNNAPNYNIDKIYAKADALSRETVMYPGYYDSSKQLPYYGYHAVLVPYDINDKASVTWTEKIPKNVWFEEGGKGTGKKTQIIKDFEQVVTSVPYCKFEYVKGFDAQVAYPVTGYQANGDKVADCGLYITTAGAKQFAPFMDCDYTNSGDMLKSEAVTIWNASTDVHVTVEFDYPPDPNSVVVKGEKDSTSSGNGTVTGGGKIDATTTSQTVTWTADPDNEVESVTIKNEATNATETLTAGGAASTQYKDSSGAFLQIGANATIGNVKFEGITESMTVTVKFKASVIPSYTFTASSSDTTKGTITPTTGTVNRNADKKWEQDFTITPATGQKIASVSVTKNDSNVAASTITDNITSLVGATSAKTLQLKNINCNFTVTVSFAPQTYTLTITNPSNGSISVNRTTVGAGGTGNTGVLSSGATLNYGDALSITATPSTHYTCSATTITNNGSSVSSTADASTGVRTATITTVQGAVNVAATFTAIPDYTVTVNETTSNPINSSDNGSGATPTVKGGSCTVNTGKFHSGDKATLTVTKKPGNYSVAVTANPSSVTLTQKNVSGNVYTFESSGITANTTFTVTYTYTAGSFTVTGSAGTGGSVDKTSQSITEGSSASVKFTADAHYVINKITVNGVEVTSGSSSNGVSPAAFQGQKTATWSVSNVTQNYTVNATFKQMDKRDVTITYSDDSTVPSTNPSNAKLTVSGSDCDGTASTNTNNGKITIWDGSTLTISHNANAPYSIKTLTVTGPTGSWSASNFSGKTFTIPATNLSGTTPITINAVFQMDGKFNLGSVSISDQSNTAITAATAGWSASKTTGITPFTEDVTLTWKKITGKTFTSISVGGTALTSSQYSLSGDTYTATVKITKDSPGVVLKYNTAATYTLSYTNPTGGTFTVQRDGTTISSGTTLTAGDNLTITLNTPDTTHYQTPVVKNGNSTLTSTGGTDAAKTYSISNVSGAVSLTATYSNVYNDYTVSFDDHTTNTIDSSKASTAGSGTPGGGRAATPTIAGTQCSSPKTTTGGPYYHNGTKVTLTVKSNPKYNIVVKVGGATQSTKTTSGTTATGFTNTYEYTIGSANVAFDIDYQYQADKLTVSTNVEGNTGGSISGANSNVTEGGTVTGTITPTTGTYMIDKVTISAGTASKFTFTSNGNPSLSGNTWTNPTGSNAKKGAISYTITNITENYTIDVKFRELPTYTVTWTTDPTDGSGGTLSANANYKKTNPLTSGGSIYEGANLTITRTPTQYWSMTAFSVKMNNVDQGMTHSSGWSSNSISLNNVTGNVVITAKFEQTTKWGVALSINPAGAGATITADKTSDITPNTKIKVTATEGSGYEFTGFTAGSQTVNKASCTANADGTYSADITVTSDNLAIKANYSVVPTTRVTFNPVRGVTITATKIDGTSFGSGNTVNQGTKLNFVVTPKAESDKPVDHFITPTLTASAGTLKQISTDPTTRAVTWELTTAGNSATITPGITEIKDLTATLPAANITTTGPTNGGNTATLAAAPSANTCGKYHAGDAVTVNVTTAPGYKAVVTATGGVTFSGANTGAFTYTVPSNVPVTSTTISVAFTRYYTVSLASTPSAAQGSAVINKTGEQPAGTTGINMIATSVTTGTTKYVVQSITVTPAGSGTAFTTPSSVDGLTTYTLNSTKGLDDDYTIDVKFREMDKFQVSWDISNDAGRPTDNTIKVATKDAPTTYLTSPQTLYKGTELIVEETHDPTCSLDKFLVNGTDKATQFVSGKLTGTNAVIVNANTVMDAQFTMGAKWSVAPSVNPTGAGTINCVPAANITPYTGTTDVTVTPNRGYVFQNITVDGTAATGVSGDDATGYSLTGVTVAKDKMPIVANFTALDRHRINWTNPNGYTITAKVKGSSPEITVASGAYVYQGEQIEFTVTPNSGTDTTHKIFTAFKQGTNEITADAPGTYTITVPTGTENITVSGTVDDIKDIFVTLNGATTTSYTHPDNADNKVNITSSATCPSGAYHKGEKLTFTTQVADKYSLDLKVGTTPATSLGGGLFEYTILGTEASPLDVKAAFSYGAETFKITTNVVGTGGKVEASGTGSYTENTEARVTVTADPHYVISRFTVTPKDPAQDTAHPGVWTPTDPTDEASAVWKNEHIWTDYTISAEFEQVGKYPVTWTVDDAGNASNTVSVAGSSTGPLTQGQDVWGDEDIIITTTTAPKYGIDWVKYTVDGASETSLSASGANQYKIPASSIFGAIGIDVAFFTGETYKLTMSNNPVGYGSIAITAGAADPDKVKLGAEVTITTTSDGKKDFDGFVVDGNPMTGTPGPGPNQHSVSFTVEKDMVIVANYVAKSHTINYEPYVDGGSISVKDEDNNNINPNDAVEEGKKIQILPMPSADYIVKSVTVGGTKLNPNAGGEYFYTISENTPDSCDIQVEYGQQFTITVESYTNNTPSEDGGTARSSSPTALTGDSITITMTPKKNYKLDRITVNGTEYGVADLTQQSGGKYVYTFTPTTSTTVNAYFIDIPAYDIIIDPELVENGPSYNAQKHGTLSSNKASAVEGETATISWKPANGYELATLTINGSTVLDADIVPISATTYTTDPITGTTNVTATFAPKQVNITIKDNPEHGSMDVVNTNKNPGDNGYDLSQGGLARFGDPIMVTIKPDPGFEPNNVTIAGEPIFRDGQPVENLVGLTGPNSNGEYTYTFPVNGDAQIAMDFSLIKHPVTASIADYGDPEADRTKTYIQPSEELQNVPHGQNVTIFPTVQKNYAIDYVIYKIGDGSDEYVNWDNSDGYSYTFNLNAILNDPSNPGVTDKVDVKFYLKYDENAPGTAGKTIHTALYTNGTADPDNGIGVGATAQPFQAGGVQVEEGQDQLFYITLNKGYKVRYVYVDGQRLSVNALAKLDNNNYVYNFPNVTSDHEFELWVVNDESSDDQINVTASATNGTVTANGGYTLPAKLYKGENISMTLAPNSAEYVLNYIIVGGKSIKHADGTGTVTDANNKKLCEWSYKSGVLTLLGIQGDVNVTASFKKDNNSNPGDDPVPDDQKFKTNPEYWRLQSEVTGTGSGTLSCGNNTTIYVVRPECAGSDAEKAKLQNYGVSIIPDEGSIATSISIDYYGEAIYTYTLDGMTTAANNKVETDDSITIMDIFKNGWLNIDAVTASRCDDLKRTDIPYGAKITVVFTDVKDPIDPEDPSEDPKTYEDLIGEEGAEPAEWFTIDSSYIGQGMIYEGGSVRVAKGSSFTLLMSPDEGYELIACKVDGQNAMGSVSTVRTYTFENIKADHTVNATFGVKTDDTFTITANVVSGEGQVSVSEIKVPKGASYTLYLMPGAGYKVSHVTAQSTDEKQNYDSVYTSTMYRLRDIQADVNVDVTFETVKPGEVSPVYTALTVTAFVESGDGTVTPTSVTVPSGATATFFFFPDEGYTTSHVTFNGTTYGLKSTATSYSVKPVAGQENKLGINFIDTESLSGDIDVDVDIDVRVKNYYDRDQYTATDGKTAATVSPDHFKVVRGSNATVYVFMKNDSASNKYYAIDNVHYRQTDDPLPYAGVGRDGSKARTFSNGKLMPASIMQMADDSDTVFYSVYSIDIPSITEDTYVDVELLEIDQEPEGLEPAPDFHNITVTANTGGTVSPMSSSLPAGETKNLFVNTLAGYYIDGIYMTEEGGQRVDITNKLINRNLPVLMGDKDINIEVVWNPDGVAPSPVNVRLDSAQIRNADGTLSDVLATTRIGWSSKDIYTRAEDGTLCINGAPAQFTRYGNAYFYISTSEVGPNGRIYVLESVTYNGEEVSTPSPSNWAMDVVTSVTAGIDVIFRELGEDEVPLDVPECEVLFTISNGGKVTFAGLEMVGPMEKFPTTMPVLGNCYSTIGVHAANGYILANDVTVERYIGEYSESSVLEDKTETIPHTAFTKVNEFNLIGATYNMFGDAYNEHVIVNFEEAYDISVSWNDETLGYVAPNHSRKMTVPASIGDALTVLAAPYAGMKISSVTVNGETVSMSDIEGNQNDELTDLMKNIMKDAKKGNAAYATSSTEENADPMSFFAKAFADEGDAMTPAASANDSYEVRDFNVLSKTTEAKPQADDLETVYGIPVALDGDKDVYVTFENAVVDEPTGPFEVTATAVNGTVTPATQTVPAGGTAQVRYESTNANYVLSSITVNGVAVDCAKGVLSGSYTLPNVQENSQIVVTFGSVSTSKSDGDRVADTLKGLASTGDLIQPAMLLILILLAAGATIVSAIVYKRRRNEEAKACE